MNPLPIIITTGVIAIVPPLRRRAAPVARAVLVGSVGVVGATIGAAAGVVSAALDGPPPAED